MWEAHSIFNVTWSCFEGELREFYCRSTSKNLWYDDALENQLNWLIRNAQVIFTVFSCAYISFYGLSLILLILKHVYSVIRFKSRGSKMIFICGESIFIFGILWLTMKERKLLCRWASSACFYWFRLSRKATGLWLPSCAPWSYEVSFPSLYLEHLLGNPLSF